MWSSEDPTDPHAHCVSGRIQHPSRLDLRAVSTRGGVPRDMGSPGHPVYSESLEVALVSCAEYLPISCMMPELNEYSD